MNDAALPVKDFPLMWKVYDHIMEHPEEWDQDAYVWAPNMEEALCGTTFCFAGHAIMMSRPDVHVGVGNCECRQGCGYKTIGFLDESGAPIAPFPAGQRALGLTEDEASLLFGNMTKDPAEIRDIIVKWETADLLSV